ncbi:MAG: penicillin acylase family protein, partial [Woeseiaceae bacterium]|nr:penicillin acylase family protein [Woeseiaceae bacterium]
AIALILVVVVVAWLGVRASLPQLDGEIAAAGLDATATIERDAQGIPVITAQSREDLAFATGFAHGQDRFFQMDLIRRQAAGELAELFGAVAVDADRQARFHRFRSRARAVLQDATAEERRIIERYADGVNAGRGSLGARPFEYLLIGAEPRDWAAEDSVIVVYAMFMQLNDARASKDVRRGLVHRVLPQGVYDWLYPDGTEWDAPIMGEARTTPAYPLSTEYSLRDWQSEPQPTDEQGPPPLDGSNNWAVGGALTASGRALVSNDMHLSLDVPNIYYQARLVQQGGVTRDVTGVTIPGAPFVIAGSNTRMAWGYTNSYGDWSDAVLIRPGERPGTYRTPDGDRVFDEYLEIINVKGGDPVSYTIRETVWGPVDDLAHYPDGEIAVSWIAHHPRAVNLQIMQLETAASSREALDIAATMGMPPQNFVTGDAGGNIGWTIAGQIPVRGDYDPMLPADWSESPGWSGWRSPQDYPRVFNPPSGRIWTANARVADGEALEIIGDGGYDFGARARQIRDALFENDTFDAADMLAIQYDDRAIFLTRWRDLLLRVLDDATVANEPELAEYRRLVAEWIPRAAPESVGYRLVRGFRYSARTLVFEALMAPVRGHYDDPVVLRISNQFEGPLWQLVNEQPLHLLPANYAS